MWLYIQAISLQLVHRWCGCWFTTTTILQPGDEVKVTIDNIGTLTTYISKIKSYTIFKKLKGSVVNMLLPKPFVCRILV